MSKLKNIQPVSITEEEKTDSYKWFAYEFDKMLGADIPKWIHEKIQIHASENMDTTDTFLRKIGKIRRLKKATFIDPVNYICTTFKVTSLKTDMSANYGFLYSSDMKYYNKIELAKTRDNPVCIMYCISPSMLSQDGEYRNRLLRFGQYHMIVEKYAAVFEAIEKFLIHKLERNELTLEYEHFFPQVEFEILAGEIDHKIVEDSIVMRFFSIFWIIEVYNLSIGLQENHINPKFNQIFFSHLDEDIKEFKRICVKFGKSYINELITFCTLPIFRRITAKGEFVPSFHSVGQKLRPLNVGEVQEPLNIVYDQWREIFLSSKAADLLANIICPSFAVFVDWFYIKNSKKGLFDNEQQYQKLDHSERALSITRKLRETQRITYMRDKNSKKFLNGMFQTLYDKIEDPIDFAKANLMMSNVTLGFVTENVGRTIYDLPALEKSSVWNAAVGDVLKNPVLFRKYMWDVCYALLALNVKCGMTHSDLHLNNVTINNLDTTSKTKNPWSVYNVMGYWFGFETKGPYACIIDFSRGTINPREIEKYPYFSNREEFDRFVDHQNTRIITVLDQTIPTFMKIHAEKIIELLKTDFDKFYKLYSAVDTYNFCSKLSKYLSDKTTKKENIALLNHIVKISEHYLTNVMLKVINNPHMTFEWPIFTVLKECFTDNIFDHAKPRDWNIIDIWVLDRPMKYSLDRYEQWPPIIKAVHGMKDPADPDSIYLIKSVTWTDTLRKDYEKFRKEQMTMVRYIAKRHKEKYQ